MLGFTRLIFNTDSIEIADANTFKDAAVTLSKVYRSKYTKDSVKVKFVRSGQEIANEINKVGIGKLITLDIISHGNQGGIHIARKLMKPKKSSFIQKKAHVRIRMHSSRPQSEADAEYMEESIHGLYSDHLSKLGIAYFYNQSYEMSADIAYLNRIEFNRFSKNSVVEFHGCRTAEFIPLLNSLMKDNFAENFSERLGNKGIVIGHITNSAPDKNPNGNINDYRYGKVRVYKNGNMIKDSVERSGLRFQNSSTPSL